MEQWRRYGRTAAVVVGVVVVVGRAVVQAARRPAYRAVPAVPVETRVPPTPGSAVAGAATARPGDGPAKHDAVHLPQPSIWPVVCALGFSLLMFGLVSSPVFSVVGGVLTAWAVGGWIGELRHE